LILSKKRQRCCVISPIPPKEKERQMLALNFLVVGEDDVFTLEIDEEENVGILKDEIKI
jgi:hypothetical protein